MLDTHRVVPKNSRLWQELLPIPDEHSQFIIGTIVTLPRRAKEQLDRLDAGIERQTYLGDIDIKGFTHIFYNWKEGKVTVQDPHSIRRVLEAIEQNLPATAEIVLILTKRQDVDEALKLGFANPCICQNKNRDHIAIMLSKPNLQVKPDLARTPGELEDTLQQAKSNDCTFTFRFSEDCVKYLHTLSERGLVMDGGRVAQREIAGKFHVEKVSKGVYTLNAEPGHELYGDEEAVPALDTLYNYHTHPREAYERHDSEYGCPSYADYENFCLIPLIFHCVVAIEGLYILYKPRGMPRGKFELDDDVEHDSIQEHVRQINSSGNPVNVKYLPWKSAGKVVSVPYDKTVVGSCGMTCVPTDEIRSSYG